MGGIICREREKMGKMREAVFFLDSGKEKLSLSLPRVHTLRLSRRRRRERRRRRRKFSSSS